MRSYQVQDRMKPRKLQAVHRMRVPAGQIRACYQLHVIDAIRRNGGIDNQSLYHTALHEITEGDEISAVFSELGGIVLGIVTGESRVFDIPAVEEARARVGLHVSSDSRTVPSVERFNEEFLNGKGRRALATALTFDGLKLDPGNFDDSIGWLPKALAYGDRPKKIQEFWGPRSQRVLKQYVSVDDPSLQNLMDRYVEYRYICSGDMKRYTLKKELAGLAWQIPRRNYRRRVFRKFDKVLGFPPPKKGRPRS